MRIPTFIDLSATQPRIQRDAARRLRIPQPSEHPYSGPRDVDFVSRPLWASEPGAGSTGLARSTGNPALDALRVPNLRTSERTDPTRRQGREAFRIVNCEPGIDWNITALVASDKPRRIWVELEYTVEPPHAVEDLMRKLGIPHNH